MDGSGSLFATAGGLNMDNGLDIARVDYKSGHFIFGFNTFPDLSLEKPQERERNETFQAKFRTLPNSINVTMYMEFDNNIFMDKTRHITNDHKNWIIIISDVYFIKIPVQGRYLNECLQNINL